MFVVIIFDIESFFFILFDYLINDILLIKNARILNVARITTANTDTALKYSGYPLKSNLSG